MRLQRRVLGYLAAAAIASCVLTVGVGVVLVRHQIAKQRLSTLEAQADLVAAVGGAPGALTPGDHVYRVGSGRPRRLGRRAQALVLGALPSAGAGQGTVDVAGRSLIYAARLTPTGEIVLIRPANVAFSEWRPFMGSLLLAGLGGSCLRWCSRSCSRAASPARSASCRRRPAALAQGEAGVAVPVRGDGRARRPRSVVQRDVGRAVPRPRGAGPLPRVGQPRAADPADLDPRLRGGARGAGDPAGRVGARDRRRGRSPRAACRRPARPRPLRPFGFSVAREPVDLAGVVEEAVERHLPRAREIGVELSGRRRPTTGSSATTTGSSRRSRT